MNLFKLIQLFRKTNGRSPSPNELAKLKQQSELMSRDNVIKFPEGGIDSIPVNKQFRGNKSLDEFTRSENIYEQSMKPKGARPGNINYEAMQEKFPDVKLYGDESFQELLDIEKTGKHPRDKAAGGRIGFSVGGAKGLLKLLQGKLGKKTVKMADDVDRPQSALNREMFDEANKRFNKKVNERQLTKDELEDFENEIGDALEAYDFDGTAADAERILKEQKDYMGKMYTEYKAGKLNPDESLAKALDEVGGNFTGDLKYDADVLASELAFQRGLIKEGGDLSDIVDQDTASKIYNEAYGSVSGQFLKNREIKKMQQFSEPTQTLKSIKEKGTMDISDPTIADEFDTFLRENDPEAYKNLEQKIQLDNFDPKDRKGSAKGGLAGMLNI